MKHQDHYAQQSQKLKDIFLRSGSLFLLTAVGGAISAWSHLGHPGELGNSSQMPGGVAAEAASTQQSNREDRMSRSEFIRQLRVQFIQDPEGRFVNTAEEWKLGATRAAPAWTGYPSREGLKTVEALGALHEVEISLPPKAGQEPNGFSPRNLALNRELDPRHPAREAMPLGLAHPSLSLTDERGKLRPAVLEWIHVRYRKELGQALSAEEALAFVEAKKITYQNLWFDHPVSSQRDSLQFDDQGRPLNPNPFVRENAISGQGFYFRLGQNIAADVLMTFEHQGRMYVVLNARQEAGRPLAFPAGMIDIEDVSRIQAAFRELGEETGIQLNLAELERQNRVQLAWEGTVAAETRQTRNAWTDSNLFHVHFQDLADLNRFVEKIDDHFDREEIAHRVIVDVAYVIQNYLMPGAPHRMGASHGRMLSFALARFLQANPEKEALLDQDTPVLMSESQLSFGSLRRQLQTLRRD